MYSSQIANTLLSDPYMAPYFSGVFPSDKLPSKVSYPSMFVANTDPAHKKGQHWVACVFDRQGNAEYFDSYGKAPWNVDLFKFVVGNGSSYTLNETELQGVLSDVCGQYCIAFL